MIQCVTRFKLRLTLESQYINRIRLLTSQNYHSVLVLIHPSSQVVHTVFVLKLLRRQKLQYKTFLNRSDSISKFLWKEWIGNEVPFSLHRSTTKGNQLETSSQRLTTEDNHFTYSLLHLTIKSNGANILLNHSSMR